MIAHVGGVPLEEALLPLGSGASAALLVARVWLRRACRLTDGFRAPAGSLFMKRHSAAERPQSEKAT